MGAPTVVCGKDSPINWNLGPSIDKLSLAWTRYIPVTPTSRQLAFLLLPHLEVLFGGAGGPGKSTALLISALQYVDTKGYAAIIIRKTYTDLSLPGALMDMASEWLANTDARWSDLEKTWHFPSGATVTFGYMDNVRDKYRYQSAAFHFVAFDELTQFPESDYTFMFGRLRRLANSDIPIRMRAASNPGGIGHDWVKRRFMDEKTTERIFLPVRISDNPHIDAEQYRRSLAELDPITRRQIEQGDWTARHGGNKFRREWFEIVDEAPVEVSAVRRWDMAATEAKPGKDPDWTVGLKLGKSANNVLYILDVRRVRSSSNATEQLIKQTAQLDGKYVKVRMEQEPGSSGITVIDDYRRRVLMGYDFAGIPSTGPKELRANPVASQAEAGNIKIVRAPWNVALLDELELFPSGSHDDQVDALSGALEDLSGIREHPPFMVG